MKAATIHQIKQELNTLDQSELINTCLRLAKYKKDSKELLSYLLFQAADEDLYIKEIKEEITALFEEGLGSSVYYIKKGLRKIIKLIDKYLRFSGNKETELEVRIFLCQEIKKNKIPIQRSTVLQNMYAGQLKKINAALSKLHEDLQYDYEEAILEISNT